MNVPAWIVFAAALVTILIANHRRWAMWLVWNVPLGPLAPWMMALALHAWPRRVGTDNTKKEKQHEADANAHVDG